MSITIDVLSLSSQDILESISEKSEIFLGHGRLNSCYISMSCI